MDKQTVKDCCSGGGWNTFWFIIIHNADMFCETKNTIDLYDIKATVIDVITLTQY